MHVINMWAIRLTPQHVTLSNSIRCCVDEYLLYHIRSTEHVFHKLRGGKMALTQGYARLSPSAVFCSSEQQSPKWFWLGLTWDNILSPGPVPPHWVHIATYALNSSVLSLPSSSSFSVDLTVVSTISFCISHSSHHSPPPLSLFTVCYSNSLSICAHKFFTQLPGHNLIIRSKKQKNVLLLIFFFSFRFAQSY